MVEKEYDFSKIEKKWQKNWEDSGVFEAKDGKGKKFSVIEMYPYPSASGLHMGHAFNYVIGDIYARFKKMQGFNVLHPMGFDSFGLPAENAAIKAKSHPKIFTEEAIKNFIKQQKALGLSYDWDRILWSHNPEYYKWNQYFFLQFLKRGLVYRKKSPVNWCVKCNSVLANEQVHDGKCWRHSDTPIEIKNLEQWFIKTTDYAEELLSKADSLDWPEKIKAMQKNWIGKSEGSEIMFKVEGEYWPVFTTRADTLMGVTFLVVSAQHSRLAELVKKEQKKKVDEFLKKLMSTKQEDMDKMEKEGVFTGSYAEHPITKEKIPIWAGNFVVADYGSGMVMAVPAHDQRDFEFAKKYGIKIKQVVAPLFVTTEGKDAVRNDKDNEVRNSIFAIVKHWKDDKYFVLDWTKFGWKSLVIGGVDKGETAKDAAIREVKEETGYCDIKNIKEIGFENHGNYYAEHKGVNRYAKFRNFLIELKSDKRGKLEEEHIKNHKGLWMDRDKVKDFLNLPNNKYIWEIYESGEKAFTDYGVLINSEGFNDLESDEAKIHITKALEEKGKGKFVTNYKLRDWLVSRQRYWGTPIPIVYCDKCGIVPVPEKDLPVKLPDDVVFGEGNPLATSKSFVDAKCPQCGKKGRRETDTMDTFFDSSWYYFRYCDSKNKKIPFEKKKAEYWMPVDFYTGGAEHACMHLIYARFFTKALRDLGFIKLDEPFKRLFNQGMVHGEDGVVMSKSRGNVIDPLVTIEKNGTDSLRMFLVSVANPDKDFAWNSAGLESGWKFLGKLYSYARNVKLGKSSKKVQHKINLAIREVTQCIEELKYNLAVIKIKETLDYLESEIAKEDLLSYIKILAPFCPHLAEELWEEIGEKGFVSLAEWPEAKESKIDVKFEQAEKDLEKVVSDILNVLRIVKEKSGKEAEKVYLYAIPNEIGNYNSDILAKRVGVPVEIFAVNDKKKYDPQQKASKAKPGKPALFIE